MNDTAKIWIVLLPVILVVVGIGILYYYLAKYKKTLEDKDTTYVDRYYQSSLALLITVLLLSFSLFGISIWGGTSIGKNNPSEILKRFSTVSSETTLPLLHDPYEEKVNYDPNTDLYDIDFTGVEELPIPQREFNEWMDIATL